MNYKHLALLTALALLMSTFSLMRLSQKSDSNAIAPNYKNDQMDKSHQKEPVPSAPSPQTQVNKGQEEANQQEDTQQVAEEEEKEEAKPEKEHEEELQKHKETQEEHGRQQQKEPQKHEELQKPEKGNHSNPSKTLVSVVVPMHNSEKYIGRCLDSLIGQNLKEIEIIVVDDSRNNDSAKIVEEYVRKDPRVHLLRNPESIGPGPTRNRGIEAARGEYVGFVDSDDWVGPEFYENLYKLATTSSKDGIYDIVKGIMVYVKNGGQSQAGINVGNIKGKGVIQDVFTCQHITGLFRRGLLMAHPDARYGDTLMGEDIVFLVKVGYYAHNITSTSNARYYYFFRPESIYNTPDPKLFISEYRHTKQIIDFLKEVGATDSLKRRVSKAKLYVNSILKNNKKFENCTDAFMRDHYAAVKAFRAELDTY